MDNHARAHIECPVCKSKNTEAYLSRKVPIFWFPVPQELIEKVETRAIYLRICSRCSHIFQIKIDRKTINQIYNVLYEQYNLDTSIQFRDVYHERFKNFFANIPTSGKLLDIGCNKAPLFPFFKSLGLECYGVDPSRKNVEIARTNNPKATIASSFFETSEKNLFKKTFDVIQMNFVMEHIIDLDEFFEKLRMYIRAGTKMFIQVPDIEYYLRNNIDPFNAHEHINYFTRKTLRILLERKGFEIIDILHDNGPSLIMCAEYANSPKTTFNPNKRELLFKKDFVKNQMCLIKKIREVVKKEKALVLYGMGLVAELISLFCSDVLPDNLVLIDDNDFYHGKIKPGFNQRVQPCSKRVLDDTLILITTSPPYFTKIRERIKCSFTGNYRVGYIENNDLIIK